LENNPGPPGFQPKDDEDGSSVSNQVQTSVPTTTQSVTTVVGYADEDSVKVSSFLSQLL
jgi:hypothetical protein